MLQLILAKPKYILYASLVVVVGYLYYDNIVVPQKTIVKLEKQITEEKKVPTQIIRKINEREAQEAQEKISNVKTKIKIDINDSGVLIFDGMHNDWALP